MSDDEVSGAILRELTAIRRSLQGVGIFVICGLSVIVAVLVVILIQLATSSH